MRLWSEERKRWQKLMTLPYSISHTVAGEGGPEADVGEAGEPVALEDTLVV